MSLDVLVIYPFLLISWFPQIFVTLDASCISKVEVQRTSCDLDPASSLLLLLHTLDAPPIKSNHARATASMEKEEATKAQRAFRSCQVKGTESFFWRF